MGGDSHPEGRGREPRALRYELGTLARQDSNPRLAPGTPSLPPAPFRPSPSVSTPLHFSPASSPPSLPSRPGPPRPTPSSAAPRGC